jgi:hypothetical protein
MGKRGLAMYEKLDALIISAISDGGSPLNDGAVNEEADRIAQSTSRLTFRVIDGRLQYLRRKNRIQWQRKRPMGWRIIEDQLNAVVGEDE